MSLDASAEALGAAIVAMDIINPESTKFEQIVHFVPDEVLGDLVAGAADMDDNKRAMARFVDNLSDERLETMARDAPEDALGEMIVAMTTFGPETHDVTDVLGFVPQEKMAGMIEAMATTYEMEGAPGEPGLTGPIPAPGEAYDPMAAVNEAVKEMWTFMPEEWHTGIMEDSDAEILGFVGGSLALDDTAGGGSLLGEFMDMMPQEKLGGTLDAIAGREGGQDVMEEVVGHLDSGDVREYIEQTREDTEGGGAFEFVKEFVPDGMMDEVIDEMPDVSDWDELEKDFERPEVKPTEEPFFEGGDGFFDPLPEDEENIPGPYPGLDEQPGADPDYPPQAPDEGGFGPDQPGEGGFGPDQPGEGGFGPDQPGEGGFGPDRPGEGGFGPDRPGGDDGAPEKPATEPPVYLPPPEEIATEPPVYLPPPEEIATEEPWNDQEIEKEFPGTPAP
jgi:hypothetical protein